MVRTTRLLGALRERFEVEVIGFVEGGEPAPRSRASTAFTSFRTGRPYQTVRYDTPWLREEIRRHLDEFRPDAVHVDYLHQAPIVWDLPLPKALDLHNVESVLSAGIAASSGGLTKMMAGRDARLLRAVEQRAADVLRADHRARAARRPSGCRATSRSSSTASIRRAGRSTTSTPDPDLACFVGIFSWAPNIDGAVWLVEQVLPLLPDRLRLELVGRNPHRRVQALAGPRVTVTGEVPDTWPYVSRASVVLAPLLTPGGTRHKILEGLLAERPVVATPEAADGLEDLAGERPRAGGRRGVVRPRAWSSCPRTRREPAAAGPRRSPGGRRALLVGRQLPPPARPLCGAPRPVAERPVRGYQQMPS